MKSPLSISVVVPAYNCEKDITRAIKSVLDQTCPVDEIIVVDDGSTDKTAKIIHSFSDKVILIQQSNAGVSAARNVGIKAVKSEWVAFLDADDEWLPNKIQLQIDLLKRNPYLVWATGNYIECLCGEQRQAEHATKQKCVEDLKGKEFFDDYFKAILLYQWGHTDCMLIRKDVLEKAGTFNTNLPIAEDVDLWLRIAYEYPVVGFSSDPLAIHHLSTENSLMKQDRMAGLHADFVQRHIKLSQKKGRLEQFQPTAAFMMKWWIRSMLFQNRKPEIRQFIKSFPEYFSFSYKILIYSLTLFPGFTAWCLKQASRFIRILKLRRRVTRFPS